MQDLDEAAMLRWIAEHPDDDSGRFVLADWLEERDRGPQAEFIRVQCRLAMPDLPANESQQLRLRERALLDAHRREWIAAFPIPVEDVQFERGLISAMRPVTWDDGRLLDPEIMRWFVTLKELDLSGFHFGSAGLSDIWDKSRFPALQKLILNDNRLTNQDLQKLTQTEAFPRFETLFLSDEGIDEEAEDGLSRRLGDRLTTLDLGLPPEGYVMTAGEAEVARRIFIRQHLLPFTRRYFDQYPALQSAMFVIAQYWCDEASDAVHSAMIVSELPTPVIEGVGYDSGEDDEKRADPNLPTTTLNERYDEGSRVSLYDGNVPWDDNGGAIPVWAAFASEGASQEDDFDDAYSPAVIFYRHGGHEVQPRLRPFLDGVQPEEY